MTTVEALQQLYVAKGGQLADVENLVTIPDVIIAIAQLILTESANAETNEEEEGKS